VVVSRNKPLPKTFMSGGNTFQDENGVFRREAVKIRERESVGREAS